MAGAFSRDSQLTSDVWEPKNAALLQKAGILISIIPGGDWPIYGFEELTFYAGYAIRHGLAEEEALKAITINPARIFGLEKRIGSLEEGKDADIVILDGPPFRVKAKVEKVFIDGEMFDRTQ
jgi:imidazolonepropionase-like amidohydrolase